MKNPLSIFELLCNDSIKYSIPLYQRNFSWTDREISQLLIDILDSIKEERKQYYIGTLVICKNGDKFSIIDGQQRFTAILLISLAIQNKYSNIEKFVEKINLSFEARQKSDLTIKKLLVNEIVNDTKDNELLRGYQDTLDALKEFVGKDDYVNINMKDFYNYLFHKVTIFINEMPENTNVNLYFERFNSRGEQLESHEIIKAELMQKLVDEKTDMLTIQKFAKIWDACSELETPCIKFFRKKIKGADPNDEREKVFNCQWDDYTPGSNSWRYGYDIADVYKNIHVNNENKKSILSVLENGIDPHAIDTVNDGNESATNDETDRYRCIINFDTLLYYVLYISDGKEVDEVQLDDKKLQKSFKVSSRNSEWILKFGENLLKIKFIFDSFIIRTSLENTHGLKEGQWFLRKAHRIDKNEKTRGHLYVQTQFDKISFDERNDEIIMLQSMFAVTFTAYKDTRWLFSTVKYLYENAKNLNSPAFSHNFHGFLEKLSKQYAKKRICNEAGQTDKSKLRYNNGVPIFAFNLMDYVLWKKRSNLRPMYKEVNFNDFEFTYRRSIEHWYPQNPDENVGYNKMNDDLLHSFGNLCNVVASQNSAFGNLYPPAKLNQWQHIFASQSLKLQIMAILTKKLNGWDESKTNEIRNAETEMITWLNQYMQS
ncbi:conserved hypothetical protein [Treponema primitia ZAS-2]|uniref:DUF262 domain-containing protein n=1 Tax=Treponema primitia (strain ATCC BAA-887 / DSM 12427 / ZAS-2) TaxID=545694 RepID=F5YLY0_TREPZ|nr:DUF262 domain-containing protein [Treponema primitia]AEF84579.1 conserved hypothetical protein [Treponema primitia ZAS-2]